MNTAGLTVVQKHLEICDSYFYPRLSSRVNIGDYARKIFKNAEIFETWVENTLIGFAAVYFNEKENKRGYISNLSVIPEYMGKGVAHSLLELIERFALENEYYEIVLEVGVKNLSALKLYQKNGYEFVKENDHTLYMRRRLT